MTTSVPPSLLSASWGRRILALFVDWFSCLALAQLLIAVGVVSSNPNGLVTMGLFILESALFTATVGGSFGKIVTRVRVIRQDGSPQPLGLIPAVIRTLLVALVVPPLLTYEGHGLHDVAVGSRTVVI